MGASSSVLLQDVTFSKEEILELFQDSGFEGNFMYEKLKDHSGVVPLSSLQPKCDEMTDCFLSHDWGIGGS